MFFQSKPIVISQIKSRPISEAYRINREKMWIKEVEKSAENGDPLWNGTLYYIDSIEDRADCLKINISTCEYKDLVAKNRGNRNIFENVLCNRSYANVQCLIMDENDSFLFGKGAGDTLIPVGGSLRKEEFDISTFNDVERYALKEFQIETAIDLSIASWRFLGCNEENGVFTFIFEFRIKAMFNKKQQYLKRGEFKDEVILQKQQIFESRHVFTDRFESVRSAITEKLKYE